LATPRILATSSGFSTGSGWARLVAGPLVQQAIALSARPDAPRFCFMGAASGDNPTTAFAVHEAFYGTAVQVTVANLIPQRNISDLAEHLLRQDVIWVGGGSGAALLDLFRLHGLPAVFRRAWENGVVLAGVSAGSICWHVGGTPDSFGPGKEAILGGMGLVPFGNGVHYDKPGQRDKLRHLVEAEVLPTSFATEDGTGLLYEGTDPVQAFTERDGAKVFQVSRDDQGKVVEVPVATRLLAREAG
jgi:peptidase E